MYVYIQTINIIYLGLDNEMKCPYLIEDLFAEKICEFYLNRKNPDFCHFFKLIHMSFHINVSQLQDPVKNLDFSFITKRVICAKRK